MPKEYCEACERKMISPSILQEPALSPQEKGLKEAKASLKTALANQKIWEKGVIKDPESKINRGVLETAKNLVQQKREQLLTLLPSANECQRIFEELSAEVEYEILEGA
jgi:hypothetical protein